MKCTVKEMIDYLSHFDPKDSLAMWNNNSGEAIIINLTSGEVILGEWEESLPELPIRNNSLLYTSENYSD